MAFAGFAKYNTRISNLDAVLSQLKQEHAALGKAIAALEGVTNNGNAPRSVWSGISAAGRQRIAAAQRARWAKIKGRKVVSIAAHKRTMSPAARRKIAAAQKSTLGEVEERAEGRCERLTRSIEFMVAEPSPEARSEKKKKRGSTKPQLRVVFDANAQLRD